MVSLPSGAARVEWRRNARARRVSLRIDPSDGVIVVTLPPRASRRAGMALLMGHVDWVAQRLAAVPAAVTLEDGAEVPIAGQPYRIRHHPDRRAAPGWRRRNCTSPDDRNFYLAGSSTSSAPRRVGGCRR